MNYMIIVFTGGDELEADDLTIDDFLHDDGGTVMLLQVPWPIATSGSKFLMISITGAFCYEINLRQHQQWPSTRGFGRLLSRCDAL